MKLYRANLIFTPTKDAFRILPHGYIAVREDGIIDQVYESLPQELQSLPVTDYGDRLMIPGFCDLHVHAPQYRNMGIAMDLELLPWLTTYTFPEEAKFADVNYADHIYRRFVHELWMQGSMRSAVFGTIHPEGTRRLADLFVQAGLGSRIGLVAMDRNAPDNLRNTPQQAVQDTLALQQHLSQHGNDDLVQAIVTPRFIPSCTPQMLTALGQLAKEQNLAVQSHLSENRSEIEWVHELEPESSCYGDAYYRYGLFGQQPTLMAHCCYTAGEELQMMKDHHVYVVHCPTSNCNIASGMAPIRTFLDAGIPVGLGSDVAGGHNFSILRIIQYAIQVSKLVYAQTHGELQFLSLSEAFWLATKSGGSFFGKVGSFEPGYELDALVIDDGYLNYDHYTLEQRLERYIYLGDDRDIRWRFCRGTKLVEPVM